MRTKLLLLSVLAISLSLVQVNAQRTSKTVYQLASEPAIDGVEDVTWSATPWDTLKYDLPHDTTKLRNKDFLVRFKIGWKDQKVFVLVDRQDDTLTFDRTGKKYQQDYATVFINFNNIDTVDGNPDHDTTGFWVRTVFNPDAFNGSDSILGDGRHYKGGGYPSFFSYFKPVEMQYVISGSNVMSEWSLGTGEPNFAEKEVLADKKVMGFELEIGDADVLGTRQRTYFWSSKGDGNEYNDFKKNGMITLSSAVQNGISTLTANNTISVYPNPVANTLNFSTSITVTSVTVINSVGQTVFSRKVSDNAVNISQLSKGLYFVKAYDGAKLIGTSRIIKN